MIDCPHLDSNAATVRTCGCSCGRVASLKGKGYQHDNKENCRPANFHDGVVGDVVGGIAEGDKGTTGMTDVGGGGGVGRDSKRLGIPATIAATKPTKSSPD